MVKHISLGGQTPEIESHLSWAIFQLCHLGSLTSLSLSDLMCKIFNFSSLAEILHIKCLAHYLAYNRCWQMIAINIIIIVIKGKITCVNRRTSDQIKEKFSHVEMPFWYRLLICLSAKEDENIWIPLIALSLNCTGQTTVVCAFSL